MRIFVNHSVGGRGDELECKRMRRWGYWLWESTLNIDDVEYLMINL